MHWGYCFVFEYGFVGYSPVDDHFIVYLQLKAKILDDMVSWLFACVRG